MTTRSMFERVPLGQNYFFSKSKPMPGGQYLTKVPDRLGDRPAGDLRPRLCWVRPALPELRAQEVQPRRRDMSHRESDRTATLTANPAHGRLGRVSGMDVCGVIQSQRTKKRQEPGVMGFMGAQRAFRYVIGWGAVLRTY